MWELTLDFNWFSQQQWVLENWQCHANCSCQAERQGPWTSCFKQQFVDISFAVKQNLQCWMWLWLVESMDEWLELSNHNHAYKAWLKGSSYMLPVLGWCTGIHLCYQWTDVRRAISFGAALKLTVSFRNVTHYIGPQGGQSLKYSTGHIKKPSWCTVCVAQTQEG